MKQKGGREGGKEGGREGGRKGFSCFIDRDFLSLPLGRGEKRDGEEGRRRWTRG